MRSVRFEGPILEIDGVGHQCEWPIETVVDLGLLVAVMFDPDAHSVVGRRTRTRYRLGDRINVQVARVDTETRTIDLELAGSTA